MSGSLVYEVAQLVAEAAAEKLADDSDQKISYRSALLLALVASASESDTSKEELMAYLSRFYDLVHRPSNVPPPPQRRTQSAEFRLQLKVN